MVGEPRSVDLRVCDRIYASNCFFFFFFLLFCASADDCPMGSFGKRLSGEWSDALRQGGRGFQVGPC